MNESTILHTVPAANELHKVPGFDPMKHLRRTVNAKGEAVMQLEPRYQRLWFRLAYPKGRMLLNPLRITDQLAIFEAKVFFHRDDPTPASSFTSNKTARETPSYIRAAQDEALKEALDNAGFGIQLCDVAQASDGERHSPSAPQAQVNGNEVVPEKAALANIQTTPAPAQKASAAPTPESTQQPQPAAVETPPAVHTQVVETPAAVEPAPEPIPAAQAIVREAEPAPMQESTPARDDHQDMPDAAPQEAAALAGSQQSVLTVLNFPAQAEESAAPQEPAANAPGSTTPADTTAQEQTLEPAAAPSYTDDMPVEAICQVMTLEEARNVVVTKGTCNGWTMAQVAEQRPSSLKFYLTGFGHCGNIQIAAARLLTQANEQQKAS